MKNNVKQGQTDARKEARRKARETVFILLFESEYHMDEAPEEIFARALAERETDASDPFVKNTYFGAMEHLAELDGMIDRHAEGWRSSRITRVSRAAMRLCIYEMAFAKKPTPAPVAISEAIRIVKAYDDEKLRAFVNGVLNAVKEELENAPAAPVETPAPAENDGQA